MARGYGLLHDGVTRVASGPNYNDGGNVNRYVGAGMNVLEYEVTVYTPRAQSCAEDASRTLCANG